MTRCISKSIQQKNELNKTYLYRPNEKKKPGKWNERRQVACYQSIFFIAIAKEKTSDCHSITNRFNDYFVNTGAGLAEKLPSSETAFKEYLFNGYKNILTLSS